MSKYLFENDYSSDSLRWINFLESFLKSVISIPPNPNELKDLCSRIILEDDSALAYFFAAEFRFQTYRMQQIIIEKRDPKYVFLFARDIENCDIRALQQIVIDSKDIKYICKFACFVPSADKKPLEDIIVRSKNVKYAHMLLKHVKTSDVNKFKSIILRSRKPRYLFELAKHTKNPKEIARIENLIIKSGSFTYIKLFAEKIKTANVDKLEQAVLSSGNSEEVKKFAKYVRKSSIRKFLVI